MFIFEYKSRKVAANPKINTVRSITIFFTALIARSIWAMMVLIGEIRIIRDSKSAGIIEPPYPGKKSGRKYGSKA